MLSTGTLFDPKSARSVAELNRMNLVQSQLYAAQNISTIYLLQSDVSFVEKSNLVNGVQSLLSMFHVSPERPMCVRNVFYSNLPSYVMDGHSVICSKDTCNIGNKREVNSMLIGIGYNREILEQ